MLTFTTIVKGRYFVENLGKLRDHYGQVQLVDDSIITYFVTRFSHISLLPNNH